jgi:hypothetical protein
VEPRLAKISKKHCHRLNPTLKLFQIETKNFQKNSGPKEKTHQDNTSKKSDMQAKIYNLYIVVIIFFHNYFNFDNDENSSPMKTRYIKSDTPAYLKSIPEPYYVKPRDRCLLHIRSKTGVDGQRSLGQL